jgi:hypothetical protein
MFKKAMVFSLLLLFSIGISGCGMSDEEKHKDLEAKLYGFDFLVTLGLDDPYRAYVGNYQLSSDMHAKNDIEKLNKKIERAQSALEDIQKFKTAIPDDKFKLKKGNDIDKDNEFEQLKNQCAELAKQLEEVTQFKIDIFKKMKDGQEKFNPEDQKKFAEIKTIDKQLDEKSEDISKKFHEIMSKYNISGINR